MSYKIARYGWLPDLPDQRYHFYATPVELAEDNLATDFGTICLVQ